MDIIDPDKEPTSKAFECAEKNEKVAAYPEMFNTRMKDQRDKMNSK